MPDSDYIPASERPREDSMIHDGIIPSGEVSGYTYLALDRSHAALDDVARELAERLHTAQHRVWELSLRISEEFEACAESDTGADCTELDDQGCYGCNARTMYATVLHEHHTANAALARYDAMTGGKE